MVRGNLDRTEIARAVERAELDGVRAVVAHAASAFPDLRAEALDIAGGIAAFTGVDSPLSEAAGIGIFKPIDDDTAKKLTRFYTDRGAASRVMTGPRSDPSFAPALARSGYIPVEHQSILAIDLDTVAEPMDPRLRVSNDSRSWAQSSLRGFEITRSTIVMSRTIELLACTPGVVTLEAVDGGKVVATGGIAFTSEIPVLFGASTLPAWRNRGWHAALIRDRLARAKKYGAKYARACARPLSTSEQNFVRCGFSVLYTNTLWERPIGM